MLLKFGRVVNLDALEGLTTNKLVGELEETLKEMDKKYEKSKRRIEVCSHQDIDIPNLNYLTSTLLLRPKSIWQNKNYSMKFNIILTNLITYMSSQTTVNN